MHAEFDGTVWQEAIASLNSSSSSREADVDAAASAAGAWYASPTTTTTSSSGSDGGDTTTSSSSSSSTAGTPLSSTDDPTSSSSGRSKLSPASIQRVLLSFHHPSGLLGLLSAVFPSWVSNGGWLVCQSGVGVVPGPTPAEAAVALKGLALAARRARFNAVQLQSLVRACRGVLTFGGSGAGGERVFGLSEGQKGGGVEGGRKGCGWSG